MDSDLVYIFKVGIFYICIDADARFVADKLNLKITNLNDSIVKCGFPTNSSDKYFNLLEEKNIDFKVVDKNSSLNASSIEHTIINTIKKLDLNSITPIQALNMIENFKKLLWNVKIGGAIVWKKLNTFIAMHAFELSEKGMKFIMEKEPVLIVYKKYLDLLYYSLDLIRKYPKSERFSLVQEIKQHLYSGLNLIIFAQKEFHKSEKLKYLNKLDVVLVILKINIRLSYKYKFISTQNYDTWSKKVTDVCNLLGGWINSCHKK